MLKNIVTAFITIFVILLAASYNWLHEYYVLLGFTRPPFNPYENGKCRKIEDVELCEDIHIHHRTGHAFTICGSEYERTQVYWPPLDKFNTSKIIKDTPYVYDIENDKLIPLVLKNFPPEEFFSTHGFGIYEDPDNENKLYIFIVNHKPSGSVIEIFEHILHTNELIYLETVQHDLIRTPNDVVPVSRHEFYLTNDRYIKNLPWKIFEILFRLPLTDVVFHSSITNETKIVADRLRFPNGINTNWDHSLIYVATTSGGDVLVYERNKTNNELKLKDRIFTEFLIDNISIDDETGELYCAITPNPVANGAYHRRGSGPPPPYGALKISNSTEEDGIKYSQKVIFKDNGSLFHSASTVAVDRRRNVLLFSSFLAKGIVRCDSLEP